MVSVIVTVTAVVVGLEHGCGLVCAVVVAPGPWSVPLGTGAGLKTISV
jgi:hypothetical protein